MNNKNESINHLTYASFIVYILLTTISIEDINFLLNTEGIRLPILEVKVSLESFGFLAPVFIISSFFVFYNIQIKNKKIEIKNTKKTETLTDYLLLLLPPTSLFIVFVRYSDYQSKIYFIWHLLFFFICTSIIKNKILEKKIKQKNPISITITLIISFFIAISFDVIFIPNKYSPTLWLAKNTTILYKDGDRTVWILPNISISRKDFLLDKSPYKNSNDFLSEFTESDLGFILDKSQTLSLYDRNLKYLQLPNQVIPFIRAKNVDFTGANFASSIFAAAHISQSNFDGADLSFIDLRGSQIYQTRITDSMIMGANFRGSILANILVKDSTLAGSNFEGSRIQNSEFENVNFIDSKISGSRLIRVKFKNVDIKDQQYVFDSIFTSNNQIKIESNDFKAISAFADYACGRRITTLNKIDIHRALQIKKFESKKYSKKFEEILSKIKKCSELSEYYSQTNIDSYDLFRQ